MGAGEGRRLEIVRGFFRGAGEALDGKLYPQSLAGGELVLVSASEQWLDAGSRGCERLRHKLNSLLGEEAITRIVVKPGRTAAAKRPSRASKARERKPVEVAEDVLDAARAIGDERLRRAFIGLATSMAVAGKPKERRG